MVAEKGHRFSKIDRAPQELARCKSAMPSIGGTRRRAANFAPAADAGAASLSPGFRFVPGELAVKCRKLIESYHAIYGYVGLPDMLWLSDARDIIERHRDLERIFRRASKSRGAKRANESFLLIATTIVSLEVLARDFSGWGTRFPTAKRGAEKVLGGLPQLRRAWLMDLYLFPPLGVRRQLADALTLPAGS
jgi:hypothetical protein